MAGLFPFRSEVSHREQRDAVVVDLSSEDADEIFAVLSSSTARRTLAALHDEPRTASDLAESLDLSLQNVGYHLRNLREADLITVADVWYSETGNEMKVYAPTATAVMVLSDRSSARRLRKALRRVFTAFVFLGIVTLLFRTVVVGWLLSGFGGSLTDDHAGTDVTGDAVAEEATEAEPEAEPTPQVEELLDALPLVLDPGVVFLLGGLVSLLIVLGLWWYAQRRY